MIKKVLCILLFLYFFTGCSDTNKVNYTYEIKAKNVDMSKYDGINSTKHNFMEIGVTELINCVDNKSSGIFYFGTPNCGCCQNTIKYLDQAVKDNDVTIYYIDAYGEEDPIQGDKYNRLIEILYDILPTVDDGEKALQTPIIFSIVNGDLYDSIICLSNYDWDTPPTTAQEDRLLSKYKSIFKPFID